MRLLLEKGADKSIETRTPWLRPFRSRRAATAAWWRSSKLIFRVYKCLAGLRLRRVLGRNAAVVV